MKSITQYNKELKAVDYRIRVFNAEGGTPTFALVKVVPTTSFVKKVLGLDTLEVIIHTIDEEEVCKAADQILGSQI